MKDVRTIDFWFCKLHFKSPDLFNKLGIDDFVTHLENAVAIPIKDGKKAWHLGGLKKETIEGKDILFGKIGKETVSNSKTVYDNAALDFVETASNEIYANYCIFIIDIKSYVIAIESHNSIGLKTVKKKLIEFLPADIRQYVSFDDMSDKYDFYDRVKSWEIVSYAQFTLTPTNPDSDPEFDELDKLIIKTGSDDLTFHTKGKLSTDNGSLVMQGIAMSAAGYGKFTIAGIKKGIIDKFTNKTTKLKGTFQTDGTDLEKKIIDFNKDFKEGKNDTKLLG